MQDKDSFQDIFSILDDKDIPYISLDLPWFGGSELVSSDMQIEDYGKFVINFIEKQELKNPVLVGHSFGGRVSIYLGSLYENISKVVLIWAAGIAPEMNPLRFAIVKTGKIILSLPWLRTVWKKIKAKTAADDYISAGKMTQIYRNTIVNDLQHYMKQVWFPTLMIWWKDDDQVTIDEARIMHSHIEDSELHILDGTHFIHQEKVSEVTKLILDFINN